MTVDSIPLLLPRRPLAAALIAIALGVAAIPAIAANTHAHGGRVPTAAGATQSSAAPATAPDAQSQRSAAPTTPADAHSHASAAPTAAAADAHSHAAHAPAKLTLDHGRKWPTDAALRQRMGEIRALFADKLAPIHAGKLSATEYQALGTEVEKKIGAIVAECKLPPAADAMLHLVVAELVAGADQMQGKTAGNPADGAHKVVAAANTYGRYFADSGWKPLG